MLPRRSRPPYWLIALPVALVLGGAALLGARAWLGGYLRGDGFRHFLERKASALLQAEGRFAPLHWQDAEVHSDGFDAAGGGVASPWRSLTAEQVRAQLDPGALWHWAWRVDRVEIEKFTGALAASPRESPGSAAQGEPGPGFLPSRVEIGEVTINDFSLDWGSGRLAGARLVAQPAGRDWEIEGAGGRLEEKAPFPAVALDAFHLKAGERDVFLTRAEGRTGSGGKLALSGRQALNGERALDLDVDFDGLPVGDFLPEDWRARLHGQARGTVRVTGASGGLRARGQVDLGDGSLEALPALDELAILLASERYRRIPLQKGHADFDWTPAGVTVTNLRVESEGLLRIEGGFTVRGDQIDGTIQVGVARGSLRWIAGVGARVFNQGDRDGYAWTAVRLHGPARHPAEDLTPRLAAAAQAEVIEKAKEGAGTVLDTAGSLLDLLKAR